MCKIYLFVDTPQVPSLPVFYRASQLQIFDLHCNEDCHSIRFFWHTHAISFGNGSFIKRSDSSGASYFISITSVNSMYVVMLFTKALCRILR